MSTVLRTDSDGTVFQIWAQQQANSCAVASIWMARSIARQQTFAEDEWSLAWRIYNTAIQGVSLALPPPSPPAPVTFRPDPSLANQSSFGNTFGSAGTFARQVADMLRTEHFVVVHKPNAGTAQSIETHRLGTTSPAIVLVGWYAPSPTGNQRTGGHFIVATRQAASGRIVYLDPWGGVLREEPNNARYQSNGLIEEVIDIRP